ncbi:MAG: polysaccharide biosynthesis C-terminal domain-containing protein [Bacteroidales bacterium]|jgi:O-antigen/teichoic acid export membrane protein|nr:polysaccharide biosynthesis C-terminal domain-containing protein [Bacteroidales bacterium]
MIKNITNTFFVRILYAVITLLVAVIISRYLGAEVKGQQGLILTTISLLHIIMCLVGSGAIVYLIPRLAYTQLCVASYVWIIAMSVFFYVVSPLITALPQGVAGHITILTALLSLSNFHVSVLVAREKIILANILVIIQIGIQIITLSIAVFLLNIVSVQSYIYSLYIAYVVSYVCALIISHKHVLFDFSQLTWSNLLEGGRKLLRYGFFNQLDVFAQVLSFRFSYYILALYASEKEVGVYSIAVSIAESIWLISRSISMVHFARVSNTEDFQANSLSTLVFIKISTILTFFAIGLVLILPADLFVFIFGKEFFAVKTILWYIAPGILFFSASFMISSLFSGIGKQHINSIASIVGFAVTLTGAYMLIPHYGYIGAAITATFSYSATAIVKVIYFQKKTGYTLRSYIPSKHDVESFKRMVYERLHS